MIIMVKMVMIIMVKMVMIIIDDYDDQYHDHDDLLLLNWKQIWKPQYIESDCLGFTPLYCGVLFGVHCVVCTVLWCALSCGVHYAVYCGVHCGPVWWKLMNSEADLNSIKEVATMIQVKQLPP